MTRKACTLFRLFRSVMAESYLMGQALHCVVLNVWPGRLFSHLAAFL